MIDSREIGVIAVATARHVVRGILLHLVHLVRKQANFVYTQKLKKGSQSQKGRKQQREKKR